jgi:uncharacterized protein (TIGR02145 family)
MKIKYFIVLFAMAAFAVSCDNNKGEDESSGVTPELSVEQSTIEAGWGEGDYSVAITGNVEWKVLIGNSTGWCSVDVYFGDGDGAISVNVDANESSEPRSVVITVSEVDGSLSENITVEQKAFSAPQYAMTDEIWTVGEGETLQLWSDEINIPECNKTDFTGGGTPQEPLSDCRDNFGMEEYGFLYTAEYVVRNADKLCPEGWRVPSLEDFAQLDKNLGGNGTSSQDADGEARYNNSKWGGTFGGAALAEYPTINPDVEARAYYRGLPPVYMAELLLMYSNYGVWIDQNMYELGCQVRCVK